MTLTRGFEEHRGEAKGVTPRSGPESASQEVRRTSIDPDCHEFRHRQGTPITPISAPRTNDTNVRQTPSQIRVGAESRGPRGLRIERVGSPRWTALDQIPQGTTLRAWPSSGKAGLSTTCCAERAQCLVGRIPGARISSQNIRGVSWSGRTKLPSARLRSPDLFRPRPAIQANQCGRSAHPKPELPEAPFPEPPNTPTRRSPIHKRAATRGRCFWRRLRNYHGCRSLRSALLERLRPRETKGTGSKQRTRPTRASHTHERKRGQARENMHARGPWYVCGACLWEQRGPHNTLSSNPETRETCSYRPGIKVPLLAPPWAKPNVFRTT